MRSVFIFPDSDLGTTVKRLDELSPRHHDASLEDMVHRPQESAPYRWVIDGALYADLVEDQDLFFDGWEPEDVEAVQHALGHRPPFSIQIDVSGRIDGTAEVRRLTLALLGGGGVALDDYSNHAWTASEIAADVVVDGLRFFDFGADYERSQGRSSSSSRG
jgi:hypothetical protein